MDDQIITNLIARMAKIFVTKDDLQNFAIKDDLQSFATKDDISALRTDLKRTEQNLMSEIKSAGDTLSSFIDELDPKVEEHEKRLKRLESKTSTSIAHQIKK